MNELVACLHVHTKFSDGSSTHGKIIHEAIKNRIDVLFITDHNVFAKGLDGYYHADGRSLLVIGGEEVHDVAREPQKNHLLALGTTKSHQSAAHEPQLLIDNVLTDGGTAFLAHPFDPELPAFGEDDISWVDWQVDRFTGLELWNGLSELKSVLKNPIHGAFLSFFPQFLSHEPPLKTRQIWDKLLNEGKKVYAIGGADAHALVFKLGFVKRYIFPYQYHFSAITTHINIQHPLKGDAEIDKFSILDAMKKGSMFIGYELPASTRGFSFAAENNNHATDMGGIIHFNKGIHFSIFLPNKCLIRLIHNGTICQEISAEGKINLPINAPGIYRLECYKRFYGKLRGWIFSNPIWVE